MHGRFFTYFGSDRPLSRSVGARTSLFPFGQWVLRRVCVCICASDRIETIIYRNTRLKPDTGRRKLLLLLLLYGTIIARVLLSTRVRTVSRLRAAPDPTRTAADAATGSSVYLGNRTRRYTAADGATWPKCVCTLCARIIPSRGERRLNREIVSGKIPKYEGEKKRTLWSFGSAYFIRCFVIKLVTLVKYTS